MTIGTLTLSIVLAGCLLQPDSAVAPHKAWRTAQCLVTAQASFLPKPEDRQHFVDIASGWVLSRVPQAREITAMGVHGATGISRLECDMGGAGVFNPQDAVIVELRGLVDQPPALFRAVVTIRPADGWVIDGSYIRAMFPQ
ncbi:MAG TPA: hypothetical protein VFN14_02860 [Candidatus Limnocylindria bacterium]|nr:hypothetical protein [Candidatus Limnocylindria bacterium]